MELSDLDPHGIVMMMSQEEVNEKSNDRLTTKEIAEDGVTFSWKLSALAMCATKIYLSARVGKAGYTRIKYEADIVEFVDSHEVAKEMTKKHTKVFRLHPVDSRKAITFTNVREIEHTDVYVSSRQGAMVYCNRSAMELKERGDWNINSFAKRIINDRSLAVNIIEQMAERTDKDVDANFVARKLVGLLIDRPVTSYKEIDKIAELVTLRLAH